MSESKLRTQSMDYSCYADCLNQHRQGVYEMKKVTVINASPRKNGNTVQILEQFLNKCDYLINIYNIYDEKIAPCTACNFCEKSGKCVNNDMKKIIESIFDSDYIVFASPVYCYSFPAPMKAFLDRLQPYYSDEKYKNPTFSRKGFLLLSCGKSGKYSVEIMEKQTRIAFMELEASFEGLCLFSGTDFCKKMTAEKQDEVLSAAEKFFN